jgi:hypothetical protein
MKSWVVPQNDNIQKANIIMVIGIHYLDTDVSKKEKTTTK